MSQVAMTGATECGLEILPHPPYSPDMAPSDFYLFQNLKSHLHGTQYESNKSVIEVVNKFLGDQENAYYFEGIRKLEQRWAKCIASKGDYIEKYGSNFHSHVAQSTRARELSDQPIGYQHHAISCKGTLLNTVWSFADLKTTTADDKTSMQNNPACKS